LGDGLAKRTHKPVFIIAGLVILIIIVVALLSSYWPKQEKWFIELGLLDEDMMADAFFSKTDSTVDLGEPNSWFIYIHNHLASTQDIRVKVKLTNSTEELPDDRKHQHSNATSFIEFPLRISINETAYIPFSWSIIQAETESDLVVIKRLAINEQPLEVDISASFTPSFRLVFELWVLDPSSGEYRFGWESEEGFFSASLYMAFRVNTSIL